MGLGDSLYYRDSVGQGISRCYRDRVGLGDSLYYRDSVGQGITLC